MEVSPLRLSTPSAKHWVIDVVKAVGGFTAIVLLGLSERLTPEALERCFWLVSVGQAIPSYITATKAIIHKGLRP